MSKCDEYEDEYRRPRKKNPRYETPTNQTAPLSPSDKYRDETFLKILDNLQSELTKRQKAYEKLSDTFGFLRNLRTSSDEEISLHSINLVTAYPEDLDGSIKEEFIHFSALAANFDEKKGKEAQYFALIKEHSLECTFPNIVVALRIYLCMMVTNCSGERSFSKLKRVKNEQRTSLGQERLNHLSLLSIEHELLREINVSDIIQKIASSKARKHLI